jgi:hypothetical protein
MVDPLPACRDVALDGAATRLARWRDDFRSRVFPAGPLLPTPLGRILERAGPDAVPQRLRRELCVHVVLGVASVRDGVAQPNSCSANIKGVAVDDRGSANDRLSNGWSGEEQDKKAEQGAHAGALHTGRHS